MRFVAICAALWALLLGGQAIAAGLIFGVQDFNTDPRMVALQMRGVAGYLGRQLGEPVIVEAAKNPKIFMQGVKSHRYDFVYAPPNVVLKAGKLGGYQPVARIHGQIQGVFISLDSSGIKTPADMKGKRLGMPASAALISVLADAKLREMHIDPKTYFSKIVIFKGPDDMIYALKLGLVDVGVTAVHLYQGWIKQGAPVHAVMDTEGSPHWTFAASPKLSPELRAKLTAALVGGTKNPAMVEFLKARGFPPQIDPASAADYAALARMMAARP